MAEGGTAIPHNVNRNTLIIALVIGIIFVVTRSVLRWRAAKRFNIGEDGFCMMALICQIVVTAIYLRVLDDIYYVSEAIYPLMAAVASGDPNTLKLYAAMKLHADGMLLGVFVIQAFFWACLWSVKFSLLFMFKRLTERVPFQLKIWWFVLGFTALSFVGALITQIFSCKDIGNITKLGGCKDTDIRTQRFSIYYSLAVDVLTDLMIMAIPISLVWNLKINIYEKLGVGLAFSAGLATIIVACLRAFMLTDPSTNGRSATQVVDITWLCFWASIECCIAVCVNCLPSFAILIRSKVIQNRSGQGTHTSGYGQMDSKTVGTARRSRAVKSDIHMDDIERFSEEDQEAAGGFRTRPDPGNYMASVTVGSVRRPPASTNHMSSSSQESIMGQEQRTKEVYVTRTVDIS